MIPTYTEGQDPSIDESVWMTTYHRIGGFFRSLLNEFGLVLHFVNPDDRGMVTSSYEKSGEIVEVENHAQSDYSKGITKDLCARDHRAIIKAGNLQGRVWGGYDEAGVEEGADGIAVCTENNITNNGADQPNLDTINTKVYDLYTKGGKFPATAIGFVEGEDVAHLGWGARQNGICRDGYVFFLMKRDSNDLEFGVGDDGTVILFGRQVVPQDIITHDGSTVSVLTLK